MRDIIVSTGTACEETLHSTASRLSEKRTVKAVAPFYDDWATCRSARNGPSHLPNGNSQDLVFNVKTVTAHERTGVVPIVEHTVPPARTYAPEEIAGLSSTAKIFNKLNTSQTVQNEDDEPDPSHVSSPGYSPTDRASKGIFSASLGTLDLKPDPERRPASGNGNSCAIAQDRGPAENKWKDRREQNQERTQERSRSVANNVVHEKWGSVFVVGGGQRRRRAPLRQRSGGGTEDTPEARKAQVKDLSVFGISTPIDCGFLKQVFESMLSQAT